jgi:hypothetical protein
MKSFKLGWRECQEEEQDNNIGIIILGLMAFVSVLSSEMGQPTMDKWINWFVNLI